MNIARLLQEATARLDERGIETARLDARLLLEAAAGLSRPLLPVPDEEGLAEKIDEAQAKFESYLARRLRGEPVSRILCRREFWGLDFVIGAGVFDPRPESETLVEAILRYRPKETAHMVDLGAGSGCLSLSVLAECPDMRGVGIDVLPEAVHMARHNARVLGLSSRAHFFIGDWMFDYQGAFDLVISNPPYICSGELGFLAAEVRCHDPLSALDGGTDGLSAYRRIAKLAPVLLVPDGRVIVEVGEGQADDVGEIFTLAGLNIDDIMKDLSGCQRVVVAS